MLIADINSVTKVANIQVSCCPTCRKYIVGRFVRITFKTDMFDNLTLFRSTIAEKLARVIYCVYENEG